MSADLKVATVASVDTPTSSPAEQAFAMAAEPETVYLAQLEAGLARVVADRPAQGRDWVERPFRPYLFGYTGKGNVGADLRVREIVRQMDVVFGHVGVKPLMAVLGNGKIDPVLDALDQVHLTGYLPDTLPAMMEGVDGVVACEGSMFTSKFSDMLSGGFAAVLGHAARQGRLAVGYGAEAGSMTPRLERMVKAACGRPGVVVVSRSAATHARLTSLGLNSMLGADSAWTYSPSVQAMARVRERLLAFRWDGRAPIAVVCPMDPFCWPVQVDMEKARGFAADGSFAASRYEGVLFHAAPEGATRALAGYLSALSTLIAHLRGRGFFPVMVGMERLDGKACLRLAAMLDKPVPAFISGATAAESIVSVLHHASVVLSSRFHACVLSLSAQRKVVGIALDERVHNLFSENGMPSMFTRADKPGLGDWLVDAAERIVDADMSGTYATLVRSQLERFGEMGMILHDAAIRAYPDMPPSPLRRHWRSWLPPLSDSLRELADADQ